MNGANHRTRTTVDFDHHSRENASKPWARLKQLRDECPVAWSEAHGGYWVVTRHADVSAALKDWEPLSSRHDDPLQTAQFGGQSIPPNPFRSSLAEMDPPRSLEFRRAIPKELSATRVTQFRPAIRRITASCIEAHVETGRIDLVMDLATQIPAKSTLELLGLPPEDWSKYALPMHSITHAKLESAEFDEARRGIEHTWELVGDHVDDRRANPRDDMVTRLIDAPIFGVPMTRVEAVEYIWTIIMGGLETVTGALAYTLKFLSDNTQERKLLIERPELIPDACDEYLRLITPARMVGRTVTTETEIGGVGLCPGERVMLSLASANHDDRVFDEPDRADLWRNSTKHLAFGYGVHRCPGDRLARAELEILVQEVLTRIPDYSVSEAHLQEYATMPVVTGFVTMPATFTARERI